MHMFSGYGEMGYGGHVFGMLFMILFWIIIIALAVFLIRKLTSGSSSAKESPMDILKKRYANGEITKEEFEKMRQELE